MKFIKQYIEEKYFLQTTGRVTLQHICNDAGLDGVKVFINNVETGLFISQAEYDEWVESMFDEIKSKNDEKLTYKVAPRFKVGDWVVYNNANVYQVKKIEYIIDMIPRYELKNIDGDKFSIPFTLDYNLRIWTLKDAKDGDVITIGDEYFLFKNKKDNTSPVVYVSHCFCDSAGAFRVTNGRDCGEFLSIENGIKACPATKEQRELLFTKMKEAGYEWNADKKELKKIEQKPAEKVESKFKVGEWISDGENTWKIAGIRQLAYVLQSQDGDTIRDTISYVDGHFCLWHISDAKDGDVLVTTNKNIFIFKDIKGAAIYDYCGLFFGVFKSVSDCVNGTISVRLPNDYLPATKEQCDILFAKMKEYGYEWDSDNKKLNEIEQKSLERSEDERIRKDIIAYLDVQDELTDRKDQDFKHWIAWLEKLGKEEFTTNIPSKELIFSIWDLGNRWKEITKGHITEEYGTQMDYIQKHWHESDYSRQVTLLEKQREVDDNN